MTLLWFHWAILGIALIVAELLVPAFVLVWFGVGALVVAALVALVPDLGLISELLVWILCSVICVVSWFKIFKPAHNKSLSGRSQAQVVGEVGILIRDVAPFQKGQIRFQAPIIGADTWDCIADESIKANERVEIVSVEGSILKVKTTTK